jgi:hypothetical protein
MLRMSTPATNMPASPGGKGGGQVQPAAGPTQPNVFQQSAGAYGSAINAAQNAANFQPQQVGTNFGYNPMGVSAGQVRGSFGYSPTSVSSERVGTSFGYNPTSVSAEQVGTSFGYDPTNVSAQAAFTGMSNYQNPFTSQVIDTSMADLERQRQRQMGQIGAQATAAKAFGGSRHGVAEALTNEAFANQGGLLASGLRREGFNTALGASQQDVANQLQASLANQAAQGEAARFGQSTGLQASLANQQAALQASLANQAAQGEAARFGQSTGLQASLANQQAAMQAALANQAARGEAARFGQSTKLQASLANQQAALQASLANQSALGRAAEFGQSTGLQAALANQQAGLQAANLGLGAASQLGGLSQQGFNMGQSITQQQAQQGQQQQLVNQALIDAARGQYAGFTGAPQGSLASFLAALGGSQTGQQTTTQTNNPGFLGYLSAGAGLLCWVAREVYGEEDDRWMQFRTWLVGAAPDWLFNAYAKHGEAFAGVVRKVPALKRILRPLMDRARRSVGFEG